MAYEAEVTKLKGIREQLGAMTLEPTSENIRLLSDVIDRLAEILADTLAKPPIIFKSEHAMAVENMRAGQGSRLDLSADLRGELEPSRVGTAVPPVILPMTHEADHAGGPWTRIPESGASKRYVKHFARAVDALDDEVPEPRMTLAEGEGRR